MIKCKKCKKEITGACYNPPDGPFCITCYESLKQMYKDEKKKNETILARIFLERKNLMNWIEAHGGMHVGKDELINLLVEFRSFKQ